MAEKRVGVSRNRIEWETGQIQFSEQMKHASQISNGFQTSFHSFQLDKNTVSQCNKHKIDFKRSISRLTLKRITINHISPNVNLLL